MLARAFVIDFNNNNVRLAVHMLCWRWFRYHDVLDWPSAGMFYTTVNSWPDFRSITNWRISFHLTMTYEPRSEVQDLRMIDLSK